jgi:uncharacterized caspase-like protein
MSLRFLIKVAALASTCLMTIDQALAENRIALVIGNSNYTSVAALPNPANDARAMASFLSSAGFQVVQAPNLSQGDMRKTIGDFASMVADKGPDTVAFVFYAGHGVQVDGENFLIPVDAQIKRETDVPLQAMRLADVMNTLSAIPTQALMVVLDACRNNPFSEINKTAGRGLAMVDAPKGSLVSYSTAPGTEALDGDGQHSPFTTALTKIGQERGLPIEQALKRVRLAVTNATDPKQVPYESSSLTTEFSFFPTQPGQERPTQVSTGPSSAKAGQSSTTEASRSETRSVEAWRNELKGKTAREAYEIVISEDRSEAYQAYLALYPSQSTTPVVRTIYERKKVMVAWYAAVTINTVASYQTFLASYGSSDFAATANRLMDRTLTRSISDAASAFAAAPTCPCNQPANPQPRQRRSDAPTQNTPANATSTGGSTVPGGSTVVVNTPPTVVYPDPVPPIVVVPPRPPIVVIPPRGDGKPPYGDGKPPKGDDKPPQTGTNTPPTGPTGGDKPPRGPGKPPVVSTTGTPPKATTGGSGTGNNPPVILRRVTNPTTVVNKKVTSTPTVKSYSSAGPGTSVLRQQSGGITRSASPMMKMGGGMGGMSMGGMSMGRMGRR